MAIVKTSNFKSACILCNCMPVDETTENRKPLPMFHAEGVDVNWGEDANICMICAGVMADLMGRVDAGKYAQLEKDHNELLGEHEELDTAFENQRRRLSKILEGKRAEKEQKAA